MLQHTAPRNSVMLKHNLLWRRQTMTSRRNTRPKADRPPPAAQARPIPPWQWFLLAAGGPIALCAGRLNLDLWHDEIYTLVMFAAAGPRKIVADYSAPNNHVLYSLVLWVVQEFSSAEFALRLPSLAFSIGALAMTFRAAWHLGNRTLAVLATLLLGLNQMFLIHAIQVRGYALSMFLFAWLVNLAIPLEGGTRISRLLQVGFVGAAFLYVMPTNLLFFAPLAGAALIWLGTSRHGRASAESPNQHTASARMLLEATAAWAAALLLAALLYAPIARQVLEHRGPSTHFSPSALLAAMKAFLKPAMHDMLLLLPLFLAGLLVWIVRRIRRQEVASPAAPLLAAAVFGGAFLLTAGLGISPFARNFCPLLPLMALAQAWTLGELLRAISWNSVRAAEAASLGVALVVVAVLAPQIATYPNRLDAYCREHPGAHDGYFNYYAADYHPAAVIDRVQKLTADGRPYRVCYAKEDHWNLIYYFKLAGVPLAAGPARPGEAGAWLYVIAPHKADWADIAASCKLPEETLRRLPAIDDFGYYQLTGGRMKGER